MRPSVDVPPALPEARGEISELVLAALSQPPHEVAADLPAHGDVLAGDDDFHLALYVLYDLHYRSFEEVDDGWEWAPSLLALRAELEREIDAMPAATDGGSSGLTPAELRLLPLLSTHLSFREIGERLFVSRNTIKTQAISVYRKLGVSNRSDAIARAAELGLVEVAVGGTAESRADVQSAVS